MSPTGMEVGHFKDILLLCLPFAEQYGYMNYLHGGDENDSHFFTYCFKEFIGMKIHTYSCK